MKWRDGELKNPFSGKLLRRDSPSSLTDGATRFPLIAEIPFLRAGRENLIEAVLEKLDTDDERGATILLLQDQDDWAQSVVPASRDLEPLFENEKINLREAMNCLKYGAVADYFAYRWSDPTFLSGLNLLENHLPTDAENVFELCCGIGHYLREFDMRNIAATGADIVFSKLWITRKFVAPRAKLVCADANFGFPFADQSFDAAFCHDAFYFLPDKRNVAEELKRTTCGAILIGHAHNAEAENFSSGAAISAREYAALFESENAEICFYDDAELTASVIENRPPIKRTIDELNKTAAIDLVFRCRENDAESDWLESFLVPTAERDLRINPLLCGADGEIFSEPRYPSDRYENEYAALSGYLKLSAEEIDWLKKTRYAVNDDWKADEKFIELQRRRILLDLPENW